MQIYSFWSVWKEFFIQIYKMGSFSTVTIMLVVTLYTRMAGFKVQIHTYFIYVYVCMYISETLQIFYFVFCFGIKTRWKWLFSRRHCNFQRFIKLWDCYSNYLLRNNNYCWTPLLLWTQMAAAAHPTSCVRHECFNWLPFPCYYVARRGGEGGVHKTLSNYFTSEKKTSHDKNAL